MKKFVILSVALCALVLAPSTWSQKKAAGAASGDQKIAVVDVEKVAKELPEAIDADKKLTDLRNKMVDTLKSYEKRFKDKYEAYTKNKSMMTAEAQKKEEDELTSMNQQYSQYQEENFGAQGNLARKRAELLQPVLARIQDAVKDVAKDLHITVVLDKMQTGTVVFADDAADITFKVIDRMKSKK